MYIRLLYIKIDINYVGLHKEKIKKHTCLKQIKKKIFKQLYIIICNIHLVSKHNVYRNVYKMKTTHSTWRYSLFRRLLAIIPINVTIMYRPLLQSPAIIAYYYVLMMTSVLFCKRYIKNRSWHHFVPLHPVTD